MTHDLGAPKCGGVYFVATMAPGGPMSVKIGWSESNIAARVKSLQTAHPWSLIVMGFIQDASRDVERAHHKRFAHLRIDGEWFRLDEELAEYIDGLNP